MNAISSDLHIKNLLLKSFEAQKKPDLTLKKKKIIHIKLYNIKLYEEA